MFTPGALMSTQLPRFENDANPSLMSVAPTVIALGSLAGEVPQASALLFPAAIAYTTPAATEFATAAFKVDERPPPRLMLAALGMALFAFFCPVTQSMPAMTPDVVPEPEQSSTRTATSFTFFATPYVVPPTVPDTCEPWPLQSAALPPGVTSSMPVNARPLYSTRVKLMPVSMM